jgi:AraC family transcriptional regulator
LTTRTRSDSLDPRPRDVPRILPAGQHYGSIVGRWSGDGFTVFHALYPASVRYPTHGNEQASLIFLESGHCTKRINARDLELGRGSMVFLPSAHLHANWFPVATTFLAADIAESMLTRLREAGTPLTDHALFAAADARELGTRLRRELAEVDSMSPLILESILLNALASAARGRVSRRLRRPPWLARVKELLHDRALAPLRLCEIAAEVGVHAGHLSREFRRYFGIVPGEYMRRLRIDHAARQLADSDAPIAEIACGSGFNDHAHFARAFRRATGLSPREHRRLARTRAG